MPLPNHLITMPLPAPSAPTASMVPLTSPHGEVPTSTVRIDAQGRILVPLAERERLGLRGGDTLEPIPTPEGR